jgi:predicted Zn-dependent peptidase
MCEKEPYGVNALGDEVSASMITPGGLYSQYREILAGSRVELFYCGSAPLSQVSEIIALALSELPREGVPSVSPSTVIRTAGSPRLYEEELDVTQGKLSIGFRTGVCSGRAGYPAMMLFNAVYGGTPTSKLFMNVREKLSLCYYASSSMDFLKGIMTVHSGIEFDKFNSAREEIMAQLECCRRGEIEEWEIEGARSILKNALLSTADSQGGLEDFYLTRSVSGHDSSPERLAEELDGVSLSGIVDSARAVSADTVYFLKGKGEGLR